MLKDYLEEDADADYVPPGQPDRIDEEMELPGDVDSDDQGLLPGMPASAFDPDNTSYGSGMMDAARLQLDHEAGLFHEGSEEDQQEEQEEEQEE